MSDGPPPLQKEYYERVAEDYEKSHVHGDGEHERAGRLINRFLELTGSSTVLDVGTGTGRAVTLLQSLNPDLSVIGIDPSRRLLEEGVKQRGISARCLVQGTGNSLPFPNGSFDAVCSFGVLHHVPNPIAVVLEMARVARKGVYISDSNRFGQGTRFQRRLKLALWKLGLWRTFDLIRTRGKGYQFSEGDGLFYSYSVFDSLPTLTRCTDTVRCIATDGSGVQSTETRLGASNALLCGFRGVDAAAVDSLIAAHPAI